MVNFNAVQFGSTVWFWLQRGSEVDVLMGTVEEKVQRADGEHFMMVHVLGPDGGATAMRINVEACFDTEDEAIAALEVALNGYVTATAAKVAALKARAGNR